MIEQTWIDPKGDRSEWGAGPWDGEPDKVQWTDETTGYVCLARRSPMGGNWCGYVGVEPGHPCHGVDYNDIRRADVEDQYIECHGGLTYSNGCSGGPIESSICHVPEDGKPDHLWWLGFDCGHAWDVQPAMAVRMRRHRLGDFPGGDSIYRSLQYVKNNCTDLAAQLKTAIACSPDTSGVTNDR